MRKKIALGTLAAMLVMGSGVASANGHWDDFWDIILGNRCANAGLGNGGESLVDGVCVDLDSEENGDLGEIDPGKSRGRNRDPGTPRGPRGR